MFKLDFDLTTDVERRNYIEQHDLSKLSPKELELCANYILYGKDNTGKSLVDKKVIYINTKYNSYSTKRPESLEALMENPSFNESALVSSKTHYKTVKPTIDRAKEADIPTIQEMWKNIDELQHVLDVNTGKVEDDKVKKLTSDQVYRLKHILIDIRRGQYYLKDIFKPTIGKHNNKLNFMVYDDWEDIPWNGEDTDYGFAPLGLIGDFGWGDKVFNDVRSLDYVPDLYNHKAKYIIDFRKPDHVYRLLEKYEELAIAALEGKTEKQSTNLASNIVRTLDYYIGRANLKDQHYTILELKTRKVENKEITRILGEKYGLHHTENYISTLWTKKICVEIANAAILHYDEFLNRDDDNAWKKCNTCGRQLLKDNRLFVKRAKSSDGLSNRCKCCDRDARNRLKESGK